MTRYKIKFTENDVINKEAVVEADTPSEALTIFLQTHPQVNDFRLLNEEVK